MSRARKLIMTGVLGGGGTWTPANLSGLALWLDASDSTTLFQDSAKTTPATADSDPVGCWADKSGNGNDATQATAGLRPTLATTDLGGAGGLVFSNHVLTTPGFLADGMGSAITLFVASKDTGVATFLISLSHGNTASAFTLYTARQPSYPRISWVLNGPTGTSVLPSYTPGPGIDVFSYDGSVKTVGVSGIEYNAAFTGAITLGDARTLSVGRLQSGTYPFIGSIYQVLVYNRAISWSEKARVYQYLNDLYGSALVSSRAALVFEGDSLTYGLGSTAGNDYPSVTASNFSSPVKSNIAASGAVVADIIAEAATQVTPLRNYNGNNVLCVWIGTNDLAAGRSATDVYADVVSYCAARRAEGWMVVVLTITPRNAAGHEEKRLALNALIRANYLTFADALADVGADAIIGNASTPRPGTYFSDIVHLTDAGYAIVADYATAAIQSLGVA